MSAALLSLLPLAPLAGAVLTVWTRRSATALGSSILVVALGIACVTLQGSVDRLWMPEFGVHWALGLDGMSQLMVVLTVGLVPITLLLGRDHPVMWHAWALVLEGLALGVFLAQDLFEFYVFFEATLVPAYFLIGLVGGTGRRRAAIKFLMYQVAGGLVLLAGLVGYYAADAHSFALTDLAHVPLSSTAQRWIFVAFFAAFAVKAPLVPLHTWLADTTEQASPATSVLLLCILDKIGTYGMIRFCLGLLPDASRWATPAVMVIAVASVVYGALLALAQTNLLRLIGLTSLSHFGLITIGVFAGSVTGQQAAITYMVNHGIVTGALLVAAMFVIARTGTAELAEYGGLERSTPRLAGVFLVAALATAGLPGLSQFVSEILVLISSFSYAPWVAVVAVTSIVLSAGYGLWTYQRIFTGGPAAVSAPDLTRAETLIVTPLLGATVLLGIWPHPLLDTASAIVAVGR